MTENKSQRQQDLDRIHELLEIIFGDDAEGSNLWLNNENKYFNNQRPMDILKHSTSEVLAYLTGEVYG